MGKCKVLSKEENEEYIKNKPKQDIEDHEIFASNVFYFFNEFCEMHNINDMKRESQNVFRASLKYIQSKVFYDKSMLMDHESKLTPGVNRYISDNTYNFGLLLYIYEDYENLCLINNKEVSLLDFGYYTGISYSNINRWSSTYNSDRDRLSTECKILIERLRTTKEATIEGSGKADLITMAKLNHYYDWNVQGIKSQDNNTAAIGVNELRERLGLNAPKD